MRLIALPSCRTPCMLLSDGRGGLPVEAVFEDVSADELAAALASAPVTPDVPYGCLLVRAPDALVLVDTGLGAAEHPFGGTGGELWAQLERAGVAVADVDIVVVSHGHLDHIGGLTRAGRPAFPRARYVMAAGEWSHWTSSAVLDGLSPFAAGPAREQLPPLEGVLEQISEEVEVANGVRLVPAPGHTPAHLAVEVGESGGLLFVVDALLHPLQVQRPDWGHGLDHDVDARCDATGAAGTSRGPGSRHRGIALGRRRRPLTRDAVSVGCQAELYAQTRSPDRGRAATPTMILESEAGRRHCGRASSRAPSRLHDAHCAPRSPGAAHSSFPQ